MQAFANASTSTETGTYIDGNHSRTNPHLVCRLVLRLRPRLFNELQAMTAQDILELLGYLVSAWSVGFAGGYTLTKFKHAMNQMV